VNYNLDLDCLTIHYYKELLQKQNLLPGRRILLQNTDEIFALFESHGIKTVSHLKKSLSTPQKIACFASKSGIAESYLIILKRELGSLEQKPIALADFPGIDSTLIADLNATGIKTSKDYFLSNSPKSNELFCLCDLVRINGVGAIAARIFYEAGFRSVSDVASADAIIMLARVTEVNEIKQCYKANLGLKDIQFCIDFAFLLHQHTT